MYIPGEFFSTEIFWSGIKWLMILGVWGVFAYGTWQDDRKIRHLLKGTLEERHVVLLLRTLHRRDMQIWLQLSLLLIVVAAFDIRHDAYLLPQDFFTPPAPAPVATPVPVDRLDAILKKNSAQGLPFSDITEFNEQDSKQKAYTDWLKDHYESWLVTNFYLQKCGQAGPGDYDAIRRSLEKELDSVHADKNVEDNILIAANGSYKEMYIDIPCDSAHISATKATYDANMQQIRGATAPASANPAPVPAAKPPAAH